MLFQIIAHLVALEVKLMMLMSHLKNKAFKEWLVILVEKCLFNTTKRKSMAFLIKTRVKMFFHRILHHLMSQLLIIKYLFINQAALLRMILERRKKILMCGTHLHQKSKTRKKYQNGELVLEVKEQEEQEQEISLREAIHLVIMVLLINQPLQERQIMDKQKEVVEQETMTNHGLYQKRRKRRPQRMQSTFIQME